jgi:P4 family phage/plasmid primase-like protien
MDMAAQVLVGCYDPTDRGIYLDAVITGLPAKGWTARERQGLKAQLKQRLRGHETTGREGASGLASTDDQCSAVLLARRFLGARYAVTEDPDVCDLTDDSPSEAKPCRYALRYYDEQFYRRRPTVWVAASVEDLKLELTTFLQASAPGYATARAIGDVLVNVKALCALRIDGTPPLPFYVGNVTRRMLALQDGLLDLTALAQGKPAKLLSHDPDWFSTSVLPYCFDTQARSASFRAFLSQILDADPKRLRPKNKGDQRVRVVQELVGYSLLPDNRFQKCAVFQGTGWNGKGTLLHVWQHLLGSDNVSSVSLEAMGTEFGTESLVGKMLNLSGDMNEIDNAREGTLKTWTGEDLVTVYRKYRSPLQIEPSVKFIYSANALPWFKDKTQGIWRRMIIVPFRFALRSDDEADPTLRARLREELPGILNWALRGLSRLLKQGRFSACKVCEAAPRNTGRTVARSGPSSRTTSSLLPSTRASSRSASRG